METSIKFFYGFAPTAIGAFFIFLQHSLSKLNSDRVNGEQKKTIGTSIKEEDSNSFLIENHFHNDKKFDFILVFSPPAFV
jgi:hypothetical protein